MQAGNTPSSVYQDASIEARYLTFTPSPAFAISMANSRFRESGIDSVFDKDIFIPHDHLAGQTPW